MFVTVLLIALGSLGLVHPQEEKRVDTLSAGTIIGKSKTVVTFSGEKVDVNTYLGIPYAKPPVADLRFRRTEPVEKFEAPFEAIQYGASCPQTRVGPFPAPSVLSEDCLFLNVFVPDRPSKEPYGRAVMVWIHGGGLSMGNANVYGGSSFVASGDVILVTINYRLGMLGFFSTGDDHAPGNMGFWDQILALKWVQKNIVSFGGDANRVTIFGESAGGVSSSLQALYPENKGLFHRTISQSGAATTMLIATSEEAKESALHIGGLLKCPTDNSKKLVDCMRQIDYKDFLQVIQDIQWDFESIMKLKLYTTVDGDFVKIHPKQLTKEARKGPVDSVQFYRSIDIFSGFNSREGSMIASLLVFRDDPEEFKPSRDTMMDSVMPVLMTSGHIYPQVINEMIKSEYTDWNQPDDPLSVRDDVVKIVGDIVFDIPAIEFARLHANSSNDVNSYLYYFTPRPTWSLIPMPSWVDGANHGDEIASVFGFDEEVLKLANVTVELADWEKRLSTRMMTYWTNFAKTG